VTLVREDDRVHPVAQVELAEDASDVGLTVPSGDESQHLALERRNA